MTKSELIKIDTEESKANCLTAVISLKRRLANPITVVIVIKTNGFNFQLNISSTERYAKDEK